MPGYQDSKIINNRKYTVYRLPFGINGNPNSMRGCLALFGKLVADSSAPSDEIIEFFANIIANSNSENARLITEALGAKSEYYDGKNSHVLDNDFQNLHWSDYPEDFFPWLVFALEVNFKDFFLGASRVANDMRVDPSKETSKMVKSLIGLTSNASL